MIQSSHSVRFRSIAPGTTLTGRGGARLIRASLVRRFIGLGFQIVTALLATHWPEARAVAHEHQGMHGQGTISFTIGTKLYANLTPAMRVVTTRTANPRSIAYVAGASRYSSTAKDEGSWQYDPKSGSPDLRTHVCAPRRGPGAPSPSFVLSWGSVFRLST